MPFSWTNQIDDGHGPHSSVTDTDTDTNTITESKMEAIYHEESTIGVLPISRPDEAREPWDLDQLNAELDKHIRKIWHCLIITGVFMGSVAFLLVMLLYGDSITRSLEGDQPL
ncbi:hypothetical protein VE03_08115 [Pseudogymnoascus sp. 23342-1-I1]|nr:hypothetical protein VE03_08115 [Pseudogymnoascus sp. 23342-1-I1]